VAGCLEQEQKQILCEDDNQKSGDDNQKSKDKGTGVIVEPSHLPRLASE
jgi:hypothetical protein